MIIGRYGMIERRNVYHCSHLHLPSRLPDVPADVRTEGGIPYRFMVYEKKVSEEWRKASLITSNRRDHYCLVLILFRS